MNTTSNSRQLATTQISQSNEMASDKATGWSGLWRLLSVGLIAAVLCAPFLRYVWLLGDEGVLLHGAERMLRGETIYTDFFEFLPPGGFLIMAGWFAITGISLLSARILAILTIVGIAIVTYLACRQASKHSSLSAFIVAGWLIVSQGFWTQVSHHWFTTLFSMIAAWITLASVERGPRWLTAPLTAGLAAGAAVMITPTRGTLAMLAGATAFLNLRRHRAELMTYALGSIVIPICLIAYVVGHDALIAAFDDVIVFSATRYARTASSPYGHGADFHLRWIFPFAAAITVVTCIRCRLECLHDRGFRTCVAFGVSGFIGCFPRPDFAHLGFSAPLVCPLLAYCVGRFIRPWLPKYQYAAAALAMASLIPTTRGLWLTSEKAMYGEMVPMPRGDITSPRQGIHEMASLIAATPSGDKYFFYPYEAILPVLTARRHVARYDIFGPSYTTPAQYKEACVAVMRYASWVMIDREWADPKLIKLVFPNTPDLEPPETKRFEEALEVGFKLVARDGAFELRRRIPGADETLCIGVEK